MALFGFLAHRATGGRRDFVSVECLEAEQYGVFVDADRADEAVRLGGLLRPLSDRSATAELDRRGGHDGGRQLDPDG